MSEKQIKISWNERYSTTMEDDEMGRWARVAYAGDFEKGFIDGMPAIYEIAWVKKHLFGDVLKFVITAHFPYTGTISFIDLDTAKAEVEKRFRSFIKNCQS